MIKSNDKKLSVVDTRSNLLRSPSGFTGFNKPKPNFSELFNMLFIH